MWGLLMRRARPAAHPKLPTHLPPGVGCASATRPRKAGVGEREKPQVKSPRTPHRGFDPPRGRTGLCLPHLLWKPGDPRSHHSHLGTTAESLVLFFSFPHKTLRNWSHCFCYAERETEAHPGPSFSSSFFPHRLRGVKFLGLGKHCGLKNLISKYPLVRYLLMTKGKTVTFQRRNFADITVTKSKLTAPCGERHSPASAAAARTPAPGRHTQRGEFSEIEARRLQRVRV